MEILFLFLMLLIAAAWKVPAVKGFAGELEVRFALNALKKEAAILHDITLKANDRTTQIDHIVINKAGIFVIETKNYQGWIFGAEKSSSWTQTIYKSKKQFHNPIWQNYGHIKAIEHILPNYEGPIFSVVVFTSNSTIKKMDITSSNVYVIHTKDLVTTIRSHTERAVTRSAIQLLANQVSKYALTDRYIKKQHVQFIKKNENLKDMNIKKGICPKCGKQLVPRTGKRGNFIGCSAFPACKFTA